jgi:molybdopterin-guanine dinucleotide biosynthesis protein A
VFDAIILAGGSARRLDGKDKAVIETAKGAERIVVVGPHRATAAEVTWIREEPPGGGPVAAIAAALELIEEQYCLVLAADLPWIASAVPLLLMAVAKTDVAVLTTAGRRNNLAAVWRAAALREAVDSLDETRDAAVHELLAVVQVIDVPDEDDWGADCDTWSDIEAAREKA